MVVQLLLAVKQCHEKGICHGECSIMREGCFCSYSILMTGFHLCSFGLLQVTLSVKMCWLLPGIGSILLTLHPLSQLTFLMMILRISPSFLTLEEGGSVILHLRFFFFFISDKFLFLVLVYLAS